jgi:N-formylglutamate amidohydrolase
MFAFDMNESFLPPNPSFKLIAPQSLSTPLILNSPHSGRTYPEDFLKSSCLDAFSLRRSEDAFVDELLLPATKLGVPLLHALFPRAFLDVNREAYELDPRMFSRPLPPFVNSRSIRVASGLGTIPRIVSDREEIYAKPLNVEEALSRVERYYKPYHQTLKALLQRVRQQFDHAVLIDCHSMPSLPRGSAEKIKADFVLGDRYGTSCAPGILDIIHKMLESFGYRVVRNKPYAGGFITEHYGAPLLGYHVVQLEVNRALYLDEKNYEKNYDFDVVARRLTQTFHVLFTHLDTALDQRPLAAE